MMNHRCQVFRVAILMGAVGLGGIALSVGCSGGGSPPPADATLTENTTTTTTSSEIVMPAEPAGTNPSGGDDGLVQPSDGNLWGGYRLPGSDASAAATASTGATGAAASGTGAEGTTLAGGATTASGTSGESEGAAAIVPAPNPIVIGSGLSDADVPALACDRADHCFLAWPSRDRSVVSTALFHARFDGSAWLPPTSFASFSGIDLDPQLRLAAANGSAVLVWRQNEDGRKNLHVKRFVGSVGGWEDVGRTLEDLTATPFNAVVAMDGGGHQAGVYWQQIDGAVRRIYESYYNGSFWDSARSVSAETGSAQRPTIAVSEDTVFFVAAWMHHADGVTANDIVVSYRRSDDLSTADVVEEFDVGPVVLDDPVLTTTAEYPTSTIVQDGSAVIAWIQKDASTKKKVFAAGCDRDDGTCDGYMIFGSASADVMAVQTVASGSVIAVVWSETTTVDDAVYAWTGADPFLVSGAGVRIRDLQLIGDHQGKLAVVWTQTAVGCAGRTACPQRVMLRRFNGANWGDAPVAVSPEDKNCVHPQVALFGDSGFVTWSQQEGVLADLYVYRLSQ